jgi:uncharacterized protein (TIGR00369 family)
MQSDFTPMPHGDGYIGLSGPFCYRAAPAGGFEYGFAADDRHGNPNGVIHGSALVTFLDTAFGHAVVAATGGKACATMAINVTFLGGVATGTWIAGRVRLRKLSRGHAWLEAEAASGETVLATATAIFRIFEAT